MCHEIFIDLLEALKKCVWECRDKVSLERQLRKLIIHVLYCKELDRDEKIELLTHAIEELMKIHGDNSLITDNKIYSINKLEKEVFRLKKGKKSSRKTSIRGNRKKN